MWSDMFYKFGNLGGDYDETSQMPEGLADRIPENIQMVYWDYCIEDSEVTKMFLDRHAQDLGRNTLFAGGIWTWNRLTPNYDKTFTTARTQLKACKEAGVREVFTTIWNATCSMCNIYAVLPGLQMWAEECYNAEVTQKQLARMFEVCTGYRLEDFLLLGVDDFSSEEKQKYMQQGCICINSSAQHFFNDVLLGLFDKTLQGFDFAGHYTGYKEKLEKLPDMGKYESLFLQGKLFVRILCRKASIGPAVTEAYRSGDKQALENCKAELQVLLALYERYHEVTMRIWHSQYKPFGWEGCDMILGGVEARIKSTIRRLEDYLAGNAERLPELEEERLFFNACEKPMMETGSYRQILTAGTSW